jgi:polar amino acid transport system substrate-binding protein/two-component system sensor histidine kinase EvgS
MPVMDGFELVSRLKKSKEFKGIPVIGLSASVMKENIKKIQEHQFDDFLIKPVQMNELFEKLLKFLPGEITEEAYSEHEEVIDEKIKEKLPSLIRELEKEYLPVWNLLQRKLPIDKVEKFGEQIKRFGTTNEIGLLIEYGDSILNAVDVFDVVEIRTCISKFPDIIYKLNNMI